MRELLFLVIVVLITAALLWALEAYERWRHARAKAAMRAEFAEAEQERQREKLDRLFPLAGKTRPIVLAKPTRLEALRHLHSREQK
jgi:hypothetical protein